MTTSPGGRLALDVGGANVKLAHSSGIVRCRPFALWRDPGGLAGVLVGLTEGLPPFGDVLLTTTAELCDCFETKRAGVLSVLESVTFAFPRHRVAVWGLDARFHEVETIRSTPAMAAAANWLALATLAAGLVRAGTGLLIDIGSTTTDLIPLQDGRVVPTGLTDTERLAACSLVYAGAIRTPVCALATTLPYLGKATGLCAELFATTLDVYLILGAIADEPRNLDTADGRPATVEGARDRLARMVGADRDSFTAADALALARAADEALVLRLVEAGERVFRSVGGRPETIVTSGSGEFLADRVAARLEQRGGRCIGLGTLWEEGASTAACARALIELAEGTGDPWFRGR